MARSQPTETTVEWLDGGGQGSPPEAGTEHRVERLRRRGRLRLPLIAAAVIGVVALAISLYEPTPQADGHDQALKRVEQSRRALVTPTQVSDQVHPMQSAIVDDLRGMADLDLSVSAVVTTTEGTEPRLVSVSIAGDVLVAPLPESTRFAFDSSGRWLAGITSTSDGARRQVLWAGPVGGVFEPVTIGAQSYAWHESRPGLLAWSDHAGDKVGTVALDRDGSLRVLDTPVNGRLEGWGEWGFALATSGPGVTTIVLDPDAMVMDQDLPGRYSGYLPDFGILLTGGAGDPLLFDPWSQGREPVPWLASLDDVWSATSSPHGADALLLIGRADQDTKTIRGQITVIGSDERIDVLAETDAVTDLAWSPDHTRVVYAEQQTPAPGSQGRIWAVGPDGSLAAVAVPDLFRGLEWVAALSVR